MQMQCFLCVPMDLGKKTISQWYFVCSIKLTNPFRRGNFAGEPPYTTGSKPCESCPYDRSYCNKNLCGEYNVPPLLSWSAYLCLFTVVSLADYSGASMMAPASVLGLLVVALGAIRSSLL